MKQKEIHIEQAQILLEHVTKMHIYTEKLVKRLEELGYGDKDHYYIRARMACDSLHTLKIWTFYLTIAHGVCRQ